MRRNGISTTRIAEICGVSQGTVDRALNNRKGISSKTKEKILAVAKEYGYRPNIHARCIAGGKSMLIGVVVFDLNNQYFSDIVTSIQRHSSLKNYATVIMFTDKERRKEIVCINRLYHMSVDGMVICPCGQGEEYENYLLSLGIPIVTIGNRLNRIPYIGIDNTLSMQETVEYVLDRGYQRLIYVKPDLQEKNASAQIERLDSFYQTCKKRNTEYAVTDILHAEDNIRPQKRNALICPTDLYAMRLMHLAKKYHAGIIGFDNVRLIEELSLPLDSVAYDIDTAAKRIVGYIVEGISVFTPVRHQLVKRGSV